MRYIKRAIKFLRKPHLETNYGENTRLYEVELAIINNSHRNYSTHPSIIHFSFNKAATQYVKSILIRCSMANGITPVCLHDYAFNSDFPFLDHLNGKDMQKYAHVFHKTGYIYTAFGGMVEGIPELNQYKIILAVRDPRDMLVSSYYSHKFSHGEPSSLGDKREYFMQSRNDARTCTIDQYVLAQSHDIYSRFIKYNELLLETGLNIHIVRYEDMVHNFREWLDNIISYCEFELRDDFIVSLVTENNKSKPRLEDAYQHLRKGTPGDYQEKLQKRTISELNNTLHAMLEKFGYNQE
jgi:hypothetical protein